MINSSENLLVDPPAPYVIETKSGEYDLRDFILSRTPIIPEVSLGGKNSNEIVRVPAIIL
tara:strand:- start:1543 stop:1722 length:180 start_codon:yes stop_codon:yes gene_type:complete